MPIEFTTSLDLDLVYARWWGQVDLMTFRDTFKMYLTDKNYRPGRPELIDFSELEGLDADFKKVWAALNMVNDQTPGIKVSTRTVLIAPTDVIFGLSRMYQTLAENAGGIEVEVYRTQAEALNALDLCYVSIDQLLRSEDFLPYTPGGITGNGAT